MHRSVKRRRLNATLSCDGFFGYLSFPKCFDHVEMERGRKSSFYTEYLVFSCGDLNRSQFEGIICFFFWSLVVLFNALVCAPISLGFSSTGWRIIHVYVLCFNKKALKLVHTFSPLFLRVRLTEATLVFSKGSCGYFSFSYSAVFSGVSVSHFQEG